MIRRSATWQAQLNGSRWLMSTSGKCANAFHMHLLGQVFWVDFAAHRVTQVLMNEGQ